MAPTILKRKQYSKETLMLAIHEVKQNRMTVYTASKKFNLPKSTLTGKLRKGADLHALSGPPTVLTAAEEEALVNWIIQIEHLGFRVSKSQLLKSVSKLVQRLNRPNKFRNGIPGNKWYQNFLHRHPSITSKVSQNLTKTQPEPSEHSIRNWFGNVLKHIQDNQFISVLNCPSRVFSCGETAFLFCPKERSVHFIKDPNKAYTRTANDRKECITALIMACANGSIPPPMVVYPYKRMPPQIVRSIPQDWGIGRLDSRLMAGETFNEYITKVFYPWLVKTNVEFPVILYVDGHDTHISLHLHEFCASKKIILAALHPNATHILQPLDVALFQPLQDQWKRSAENFRIQKSGSKLEKTNFAPLLKSCLDKAAEAETIINGFRTRGLFPLNPNAIDYSKLMLNCDCATTQILESTPVFQSETPYVLACSLKTIENRLPTNLKIDFEQTENDWEGPLQHQSLYNLWRRIHTEVHIKSDVH